MTTEARIAFTPEQISNQSEINVNYLCHGAVAFLKENNLPMDEFWAFVGTKFTAGWKQGLPANTVAALAALNVVSGGGKLLSLVGNDAKAEAKVQWPHSDTLEFFNLSQEDSDTMFHIFGPIANSLGYKYEWQRHADEVTMIFSQ